MKTTLLNVGNLYKNLPSIPLSKEGLKRLDNIYPGVQTISEKYLTLFKFAIAKLPNGKTAILINQSKPNVGQDTIPNQWVIAHIFHEIKPLEYYNHLAQKTTQ